MRQRIKTSSLMLTKEVNTTVAIAKAAGCVAVRDDDAGTIDVFDGEEYVIRAIQKGDRKQPWIVMFFETDRIKWADPE